MEKDRRTMWALRSQLVYNTHNRQERMPCLHRLERENQLPEMSSGFYMLKHIREGEGLNFLNIWFKLKVVLWGQHMCLSSIFDYFVHFSPQLLKLDLGSDLICYKSISYTQIIITKYITVNSLYYLKMYFNLFCESIDRHSFNFDFESSSPPCLWNWCFSRI